MYTNGEQKALYYYLNLKNILTAKACVLPIYTLEYPQFEDL